MKDTLKKYSPKPDSIDLGWFNKYLKGPEIWKWNKKTISRAFAIGLFFAFLPLPMHTLLVAIFAVVFSANILLSILVVWINNPITMVPFYFFTYKLGALIMGIEMDPEFQFTLSYLMENFGNATVAFWIGGLITSIITSLIGYFSIILIYKYKAYKRVKRWK
jgi:hypothetical protein